ncbi:unnamed protein product [Rotaria sp. Silwood1]|nr:unnamed protein product [Rotaria sp. Silwood1]CAF3395249.1 unnamed protein product [Rotaria sp. Silwood1]CAF4565601.1 unnamed protein product [Rotaria sp. Silwood1]
MPERKDSVDSFDDFFGVPKTDNDRRKSSIKPKQNDTSNTAVVKTQPIVERSRTPTRSEERRLSSPKSNPTVNNAKTSSAATNGYKNTSSEMSNRAESVQSKVYESDFDNDNGFDDDETIVESTKERKKKHGSLPPSQKRTYEIPRRGSDSELKSSYTTANHNKTKNGNIRRNETILPYIRPKQIRRPGAYPIRRRNETHSSSTKNEMEQRALSAQNNKVKALESRLAELRRELEAQRIENSTLRTIQRREEKAIKQYEEKEFDIHRIVRDFTYEIEHMKEVLSNEREVKMRLEKQIEAREEKLRDQTKRIKKYEKIVEEKNLDERYELHEKLNATDKKLQEVQEKLTNQEKYIDNLEKNHRHEINQEIIKQRELKRQLEMRSQKYNDLLLKFEDKTRQIDTMHIYVQRGGKRPSDSPTNLSKSRSLQSLQETSSHSRDKINDYDKKRREQQEREKKSKSQQRSSSNDSSPKHEKKKIPPKKLLQNTTTTTKNSSNDEKFSTTQNGHLPPKGKPPTRRLSTPKSVDEDKTEMDNEDFFGSKPKKLPPPTNIQRSEQHLSHTQLHKRPIAPIPSTTESKYNSSGTGGNTSSSIFKLTEPSVPTKSRTTRPLDEKWSDMFGSNEKEDSAKEDLLAKLVADEQQERRLAAAAQSSSTQRPSMNMFESSTRSTATTQPTTTTAMKPSADPFESLFSTSSNKPTANRKNDPDDIFSTKSSNQPTTTQTKDDTFESLFGPSSTANNSTTVNSNSKQYTTQNDKLQRPKIVTNATRSIPNRTVVDEVEEFVL